MDKNFIIKILENAKIPRESGDIKDIMRCHKAIMFHAEFFKYNEDFFSGIINDYVFGF